MFGSTVLEVAIGLVFLYLSLSMACSALNEYYSALMSRRAAHLRDSLFLLFNKDDPRGLAFLLEFYTHPLISGLSPARRRIVSTAGRDLNFQPPWYQAAVLKVATFVGQWAGRLAGWVRSLAGGLKWTLNAFRDPQEVGDALSGLRKELADAARSTPHYIPDRAFSGAIFAVLASDAGAVRRLQVELKMQLAGLNKVILALDKVAPDAAKALATRLGAVAPAISAKADVAKAPEETIAATKDGFQTLLDSIPVGVPPNLAVLDARERIGKAREAVLAVGPRIPSPEEVRDHVWEALAGSLHRLESSFGLLPAGTLRESLMAKLKEASTAVGPAKIEPPMSLQQARDAASRTFALLQGTLDGLKSEVDSSKAVGWLEHEVVALAESQEKLVTIAKLRDAVEALPTSDIRAALLSLMDEVGDDLDKVKQNIQVWYNDSMERVSGWYKRNTQVILAIIALSLAVVLNADSLAIADKLYKNSSLRANVDALAGRADAASPVARGGQDSALSEDWANAARHLLNQSGLPLGWTEDELKDLGFEKGALDSFPKLRRQLLDWKKQKALLAKVLGLVLTTIAISMGAPFWFDVLNKLVNVRTVGLQPQKSSDRPVETKPRAV